MLIATASKPQKADDGSPRNALRVPRGLRTILLQQ